MQAARAEYDKVEEIWIKKFHETVTYAKKVHAAFKAFVDHRHEEARKKAFGKHQFLFSGQEKANAMLVEGEKSQKSRYLNETVCNGLQETTVFPKNNRVLVN